MVLVIQWYCRVPIRDNKGFLKDLIFSKFPFPQGEPPGLQVESQWLQSVPPVLHGEPLWLLVNLHVPSLTLQYEPL
jgi:hypothetical protein